MISVDEALSRVLSLAGPPKPETIPLSQSLGRVMVEPAVAQLTQPPFNAAAMDGYAIRDAEARKGTTFEVIGQAAAGHPWQGEIKPGTAIRIFTGAPVPPGYDRVVMQENVTRTGDQITLNDASGGFNIRPQGLDFMQGDTFYPRRRLTPRDIGLLASMNCPVVTVAQRSKVSVIAGGDELVAPGITPADGQIISSNDLAISALAKAAGADVVIQPIARDNLDSLRRSFENSSDADLVVTIGGASVGDHDLVAQVAAEMGMERSFYKIAMRPGKPLMAGRIAGSAMLGLPGNPVSAMVCGILFMQPLIYKMQGIEFQQTLRTARLKTPLKSEGPRQHYLRARIIDSDSPEIEPMTDQDSARQRLFADANALLVRPANDPARQSGELVNYLPL